MKFDADERNALMIAAEIIQKHFQAKGDGARMLEDAIKDLEKAQAKANRAKREHACYAITRLYMPDGGTWRNYLSEWEFEAGNESTEFAARSGVAVYLRDMIENSRFDVRRGSDGEGPRVVLFHGDFSGYEIGADLVDVLTSYFETDEEDEEANEPPHVRFMRFAEEIAERMKANRSPSK